MNSSYELDFFSPIHENTTYNVTSVALSIFGVIVVNGVSFIKLFFFNSVITSK